LETAIPGDPKAKARAAEEKETNVFIELADYFVDRTAKNEPYELDRVHDLLNAWLNARIAKLIEIQNGVESYLELFEDPKIADKIDRLSTPTGLIKLQMALKLGEISSDLNATRGFMYFMLAVFQTLAVGSSSDVPTKMALYAPALKRTSEALKASVASQKETLADPFLVLGRFLKESTTQEAENPS